MWTQMRKVNHIETIGSVTFIVTDNDTQVIVLFLDSKKVFKIHVLEGGAWQYVKELYCIVHTEDTQVNAA